MKIFSKDVFLNRRKAIHSEVKSGIAIFVGNTNLPYNYKANVYKFRQDSTFMYFFGISHPGYCAVMDFDSGIDIIYGDDITIEDIIWMGELPTVQELAAEAGVTITGSLSELSEYVKNAKSQNRKIHFTRQYHPNSILMLSEMLDIHYSKLNEHLSQELTHAVVEKRLIKEDIEIEHLDKIMEVAYAMHTTAMKMAKEGVYEYEIAGAMEGIAGANNGYVSFPIILSKHGEILHNENHCNRLVNGDLLLVDGGFDSALGYATDHTRTFPVGGNFSDRQKDIYNIVLAANDAVHNNAKPGILYREMHFLAARTIAQGLKDLGLMKGNINEAVESGAHTLFFPHGLGHAMGMDVHDMENLGEDFVGYTEDIKRSKQFGTAYLRFARKLEPGYVMTNEPGIYFIPALIKKWKTESLHKDFLNYDKVEQFIDFGGIRLEDDLLITETGVRNLGEKRIPIYPDELKNIIGK
jgi:Xaa-Pro aminopeptidase